MKYLLLPHMQFEGVKALNGPFSWGFPAVTKFLGFIHQKFTRNNAKVSGVGIVCHRHQPLTVRGPFNIHSSCLRRGPLDISGTSVIFDEPRIHLDVSLILKTDDDYAAFAEKKLAGTRMGGGSLLRMDTPRTYASFDAFLPRLAPGYVLISRPDALRQRLEEMRRDAPNSSSVAALIDLCARTWTCGRNGWTYDGGDFVPLAVGYRALFAPAAPGEYKGTRDNACPAVFAENIFTLGQWLSPHKIVSPDDIFWRYEAKNDTYLCVCGERA